MAVATTITVRRPSAVHVLVGALVVPAAAALAVDVSRLTAAGASAWAAAIAVAVAVAVTDQLTLDVPHGREVQRFGLTEAVWVAAILLAPAGAPTLGAAAGALGWQLVRRVPPTKLIFNVAQVALALTAAELIWRLPEATPGATEPAGWALAAAAAAAAFAINETTVAAAIALSRRERLRSILMPGLRISALQWSAAVAVGVLAALAWSAHPVGLLLVVPPLVVVWLAHREFVAGLVEREQMQDLADTAERIARDRDPAARLPIAGRTGRLLELTAGLNRMLAELERAYGREHRLMRAAAQGLRAPVRRLQRRVEVEDLDTPQARARVLSDVGRVTRMLEEMETVVRAARPGAVQPTCVELDPFLHRVGADAGAALDGRLTVVAPDADATARIDARWMERALLQLLDNARVHGRASHVELRARRTPRGWRFEVADEGGGVPAGHEEAVFEPFYRISDSPERPGLGLTLVRGVADAHGGSAGIANRPGFGVTFWLRVPA